MRWGESILRGAACGRRDIGILGESRCHSGFETRRGNSSGRDKPVHPLASSPRPWKNIIVAGEVEGLGAGTVEPKGCGAE